MLCEIALSFLVKIISNRTFIAPAGRDLEIAPTVDAPSRPGDRSYKDAISDSAEYKWFVFYMDGAIGAFWQLSDTDSKSKC